MSDRANRILDTARTAGWLDVIAMLDEQAKEPLDELYEIMVHQTEKATESSAFLKAGKARGLRAFKQSLLDEIRKAEGPK